MAEGRSPSVTGSLTLSLIDVRVASSANLLNQRREGSFQGDHMVERVLTYYKRTNRAAYRKAIADRAASDPIFKSDKF